MDVWDEAVQFLLIGDRARQLAERHPLTADGCSSCARPGCVAARMAVAALELLEQIVQIGDVPSAIGRFHHVDVGVLGTHRR